jgi:hypothetical protein
VTAIERVRALVYARRVLHLQLDEAVGAALREGVGRTELSGALGISRAGLYRQYSCWLKRGGELVEEVCELRQVDSVD